MTGNPQPELVDRSKFSILVADYDEIGRKAVCRILERAGYAFIEASSGQEARETLAAGGVSLLLADIKMDGNMQLELLQYARSLTPRIPSVLMTGHATVETAAAAASLGVSAYLLKPLEPKEMLAVVQREYDHLNMVGRLKLHRQRQESLLASMCEFEDALDQPNRDTASDMVQSYACLAFENALESLVGVKTLLNATLVRGGPALVKDFSQSRPALLIGAIQEAISVIDRTKHSFKSRELAALRQKLETVLREEDRT